MQSTITRNGQVCGVERTLRRYQNDGVIPWVLASLTIARTLMQLRRKPKQLHREPLLTSTDQPGQQWTQRTFIENAPKVNSSQRSTCSQVN